jgi:general secretion pathway protein N
MRFRLRVGRKTFLAAAFLFALVALLPLRLAIDWLGFGERSSPRARRAEASGAAPCRRPRPVRCRSATSLRASTSLPLFLGRARLSLAGADAETGLEGAVTLTRHSFGFDDVTGRFRTVALFAPLPFSTLDFDDVSAASPAAAAPARRAGSGRASPARSPEFRMTSGLSGVARCADEALLCRLVGQSGTEQLNVRLYADGRYRLDLIVRTGDEAVRTRLAAAGFRAVGNGHVLRIDGRF